MKKTTACLLACCLVKSAAADNIFQDGLLSWVQTAQTDRSDVLVVGDSVVLSGGDGWDAGLIKGFGNTTGIAGTGYLAGRSAGQGEGYFATNTFSNDWLPDNTLAFGSADDRPIGQLTTFGSGTLGILVDGTGPLGPQQAYDYKVWAASDANGGRLDARRRLGQSPWTVGQTQLTTTISSTGNMNEYSFSFGANTDPSTQFLIDATGNVTIAGQRLIKSGASGVTVTSWGYGGQSTLDFYQDLYAPMSSQSRQNLLQRIVDGGSGKLAVMLMEGFNDRNEDETSLGGNTDGDSPEAFIDNIEGLINLIANDWAAASLNSEDLSFVTFGMYEIASGNDKLDDYRLALEQFALSRNDVSFMDLRENNPTFAEGDALGYYTDSLHLSRDGAMFYGDQIAQNLASIPEPSSMALLSFIALLLTRRRRD